MNKTFFIVVSFLILILSLHDIKAIPFYKDAGLDFSNNYGFHHCKESSDNLYKIDPSKCADFEARPYVYPPFLYQAFSWTKLFNDISSAYLFFLFLHVASFLLVVYIWAEKKIWSLLFGLGLFFTYPNLFLLERGNSDMLIVLVWSLAFMSYQKNNLKLTGTLLGVAVLAKLYPVYSIVILSAYFYNKVSERNTLFKTLIVTGLIVLLISPVLWFEYVTQVLPEWSGIRLPVYNLAHSLKSIPWTGVGSLLFLVAFLCWIISAKKASVARLDFIWAGALAISTFNNGVSYDYNLVTIFPLAIVGFNYLSLSKVNNAKMLSLCFIVLFFTAFGFRELMINVSVYPLARLCLLGLTMIAIPFFFFDLSHETKRVIYFTKLYIKREF